MLKTITQHINVISVIMAVHYGASSQESKENVNIEGATSNDRKGTKLIILKYED